LIKRILLILAGAAVFVFVAIQLIPVPLRGNNPPVAQEPEWDSLETRDLAVRACYDCHSNETVWPAYAYVAPASWLLARDVQEGREVLNFSEWGSRRYETHEIVEVMQRGSMPPRYYLPLHPTANLTEDETRQLLRGVEATFGVSAEREGAENEENER